MQYSHLPPLTLKLNLPGLYPRIFASRVMLNSFLMTSKSPVYVAGLLRGVFPIGDWSISITLSICEKQVLIYIDLVFRGNYKACVSLL